jgi:hypothetical protein
MGSNQSVTALDRHAGLARTVLDAGSYSISWQVFFRSISIDPSLTLEAENYDRSAYDSHRPWPIVSQLTPWPPLRTAIFKFFSFAYFTAAITGAVQWMNAGAAVGLGRIAHLQELSQEYISLLGGALLVVWETHDRFSNTQTAAVTAST